MAAIGTKKIDVLIDGEERDIELTSAAIARVEPETGTVTFAEADSGGGDEWEFRGTALQDAVADTLLDLLWEANGTDVPVVFKPYGNETPSATEPHYEGTVTISMAGTEVILGGAAATGNERQTFDFVWTYLEKPLKVTA